MLYLSVQNCHELEKMDLEECILVRKYFFQALFSWSYSRLWKREDSTDISSPQVTDNTLVQLSIHCPRLQALVTIYRYSFLVLYKLQNAYGASFYPACCSPCSRCHTVS